VRWLSAQGDDTVAIGFGAGATSQNQASVAIGLNAGNNTQGQRAVAIGVSAGSQNQGDGSVAIGDKADINGNSANCLSINSSGGNLNNTGVRSFTLATVAPNTGVAGISAVGGLPDAANKAGGVAAAQTIRVPTNILQFSHYLAYNPGSGEVIIVPFN